MTSDVTLQVQMDPELRDRFEAAAAAAARSPQQLLRELVEGYIDRQGSRAAHEGWFREAVEDGIRDANDPSVHRIPNSLIETEWHDQRRAIVGKIGAEGV